MSNPIISVLNSISENIIILYDENDVIVNMSGKILEEEPKIKEAFLKIKNLADLAEKIFGFEPGSFIQDNYTIPEKIRITEDTFEVSHIPFDNRAGIKGAYILSRKKDDVHFRNKYSELNKNFKAILDSVPEAAFMIDDKGDVLLANKALSERFNISSQEITGKNIYDLMPPEVAKFRKEKINTAIEKNRPVYFEDMRNDRILDTYVYPVAEEGSDRITKLTIVGIDRTMRKKAEKELALKARLLDSASDTILLIDKQGNLIYFNESAYKSRGYSRKEFANKKLKDIISPDQINHLNYRLHNLFIMGSDTFESEHIRKDGSVFPVEVISQVIRYDDGDYYLSVIRDISGQKENDKIINSYIDRLEKDKAIIEKNSDELKTLNQKLALSETKLRESNRQKDKFFSILAHDLKSPFSAILGYTEILKEDYSELEDGEVRMFLDNLDAVARSVFELLENLLEWSRIQTGRISINKEPVNFYQVAENVLSLYFENAAQKNITMYNNFEKDALIYADKNMLNTVFRNLVSNAIKFTGQNGQIKLSSKITGDKVILEFADNGQGIEPENIDLLFRIDKSISTKGTNSESGTGLGLILCKELAEKNGGSIDVKSEPGKGASFYLNFPLIKKP